MTQLKKQFLEYNRKYFGGRLPEDTVVKWFRSDKVMGCCYVDGIRIDRQLMKWHLVWRVTLLHEMCHLATEEEASQHGRKWKAQMKRLLKMGAFNSLL